jgi:hypothetical protein
METKSAAPPAAAHCMRYETEEIHHLELFEHFRVESAGHRPFRESYSLAPDSPIVPCSDSIFSQPVGGITYNGNGAAISIGSTYLCASYSSDKAGWLDFNYNATSRSAVVMDLPLIKGLNCHNCYLYLGVCTIIYFTWHYFFVI